MPDRGGDQTIQVADSIGPRYPSDHGHFVPHIPIGMGAAHHHGNAQPAGYLARRRHAVGTVGQTDIDVNQQIQVRPFVDFSGLDSVLVLVRNTPEPSLP